MDHSVTEAPVYFFSDLDASGLIVDVCRRNFGEPPKTP